MQSFETLFNSPYATLGLEPFASEEEVRKRFHEELARGEPSAEFIAAYNAIKTREGRKVEYFLNLGTLHAKTPRKKKQELSDGEIEALIRELAFLSDWELGIDNE